MSVLWNNLSTLRTTKGISLKEMGRVCGVSPQGVQTWKNSGRVPLEHVDTLARYFGVTTDWLLGRESSAPAPADPPAMLREPPADSAACRYPADCDLPARLDAMQSEITALRARIDTLLGLLGAPLRNAMHIGADDGTRKKAG